MFVFESTLNRRVDERYNGIIYIRINSKLVISEWGSIDRESNGEGRRKKEKRIVLPKTVRQKCNKCVLFQTKILGKIVRAVPESMHVRKEFTSCPSPKPFDTSGENVILQRNVIPWHDISKIISRTDSTYVLAVGRNKKTEGREEGGGCKEDHRDD